MKQYIDTVKLIQEKGEVRPDRTGTGTKSYFGVHFEHDCADGFPLVTHKKMGTKSVFAELIWFLAGDTNSHNLEKLGSTIWKEWANEEGDIGPMYGAAWRGKRGHKVDQLAQVLKEIKHNPNSRRMLVSAWVPELLPDTTFSPVENVNNGLMALAPCHVQYQFYVSNGDTLNLKWDQRSVDTALGLPYNIASYAALLYMMAYLTDLKPGRLIASLGDTHLYMDHINEGHVDEILSRELHELPTMDVSGIEPLQYARQKLTGFQPSTPLHFYSGVLDFLFIMRQKEMINGLRASISNYKHGPSIKMKVSV